MKLIYKDRAKERLQGTDENRYLLSAPPPGYVPLPATVDDEHFEYAIICADGQWQAGVARVSVPDEEEPGNRFLYLTGVVYANSAGTDEDITETFDFGANPAEVFCTISADTMNKVSALIEQYGGAELLSDVVGFYVGSEEAPVTTRGTLEPAWPIPACPVRYVEYEFRVEASEGQNLKKVWAGTAVFNENAAPVISVSVVSGAENTDYDLAVTFADEMPALQFDCTVNVPSGHDFRISATARNIHNPACW